MRYFLSFPTSERGIWVERNPSLFRELPSGREMEVIATFKFCLLNWIRGV